MRRLSPAPDAADLDDAALADAYAYPDGPWLRANMVSTLDGAASAAGSGLTEGISGPADRRLFGLLRGLADAVLVGGTTVRREGYGPARPRPGLAERRQAEGRPPAPVVAVVSARLDLDPAGRLFTEAAARTVVLTTAGSPPDRRAALAEVADVVTAGDEQVDPVRAVRALHARGHTRLLCEGGPQLLGQVAAAGLLDELCLTVSPLLAAGDAPRVCTGPALVPALGLRLGHVLEEDGTLFCRYLHPRG